MLTGTGAVRTRRGITLTEMLAVTAGMGCLIALLLPTVTAVRDAAHRAACMMNLSRLGEALLIYAGGHDGFLPDCGAYSAACLSGGAVSGPKFFPSRWDAPGTCNWPQTRTVGNQANLWILVREGYATVDLFICPATADRPSINAPDNSAIMGFLAMDPITAFPTPAENDFLERVAAGRCSYSYQSQFVHTMADPGLTDPRCATTHTIAHPSRLAIMADRNPYTRPGFVRQPIVSPSDEPEANSPNHNGMGQNVLYLGGEVEWHDSPLCGPLRPEGPPEKIVYRPDNIYRPDVGEPNDPLNFPRSLDDTYLAP
jgi:type II secretory pathway pseudopilin PulG